ncbi:MAG: chemotaxis protein CheB [Verrucomicrobiota bacterium]|nr:chemotaxis protein CheB [Verrucomicrobiota bacterium]
MPGHDIIVIGASAGGVEAIPKLLSKLPLSLAASIFVVLHVSATSKSYLPDIINKAGGLKARHARDGDSIQPGVVYVAPPDQHMLLEDDHVVLDRGAKENRHRPAIDPLFRTAAHAYGPRVIGIILTGALDDGTLGLQSVKSCGGISIVQDPADAMVTGMVDSALRYVEVDHKVALKSMPRLIEKLVKTLIPESKLAAHHSCQTFPVEHKSKRATVTLNEIVKNLGAPSGLICPDCGGPLWELDNKGGWRYTCLVGHTFSPQSFLAAEGDELERALWVAIKTLEERSSVLKRIAQRPGQTNGAGITKSLLAKAREFEEQATLIRSIIRRLELPKDN